MAALIVYEEALEHLGLTGDGDVIEGDFRRKMESASAMVLRVLREPDEDWSSETDPEEDPDFAIVQAAIYDVLGNLYGIRGDGDKAVSDGPLTKRILDVLKATGLVDPTLA